MTLPMKIVRRKTMNMSIRKYIMRVQVNRSSAYNRIPFQSYTLLACLCLLNIGFSMDGEVSKP